VADGVDPRGAALREPLLAPGPDRKRAVGGAGASLRRSRTGASSWSEAGGAATATGSVRGNWPELIEVLARHAARCLEVLTISRFSTSRPAQAVRSLEEPQPIAALGPEEDNRRQEESARRYARLLISEVKLYNEMTVEEGRQNADILARLGSEIERARRLYEEKIPAVVRERAGWFDEELVRTLAGGDAGLLGQVT